ncbi:rhomboid family intramembrane serine protease [Chamaesiphon sp.]|uniref:rhomboid family intramembrane serine protease n=1 Tax=Chamaesiphon sp. TaxID=2814140 RepID=UPI0035931B04
MDFTSIVLVQIAMFYCVAMLLPTSRSNTSLKISAVVVLIILSMSWYYQPERMSKIGIGAWIVLLLIPMSLMQRLESLIAKSQYLAASRLAKVLRWLMPTDGMWNYHQLLAGIEVAQTGQFEAAQAIFDRDRRGDRTEIGRSATALLYRSLDRWHEYIAWVEARLTREQLQLDRSTTLVYYLRAFAETGDLRRCIAEVMKLDRDRQLNTQNLQLLKMYILAYCGRVEAVSELFHTLLSTYPADIHQFWIGTAELAAGKVEVARHKLTKLQRKSTTDRCIQQDITWRLSQPLPNLDKLTPIDWATVAQIEATISQDARYSIQTPTNAATPVTNLLIVLNVLIFCAELAWQSKAGNGDFSLISWGGLAAPLVLAGEWWRIVTANFIHLGILHLGMNMLGLFYLGKFVEHRLGSVRYLLAYLLAGIGSMAFITYFDTRWANQLQVTVGASGAIMGMLGAMGAIHLRGWRQTKVAAAGRQFQTVLFSVGFQLIFDLTNGRTSISGHFSGLTIGFVVGLILLQFGRRSEVRSR